MNRPSDKARPVSLSRRLLQAALLGVLALLLYAGIRQLPTGTNLSHMDFRDKGTGSLQLCDPSSPQFIPAKSVPSPVQLLLAQPAARVGHSLELSFRLKTLTGRPIGPEDLLVVHTRRLHLLIIGPTLADYQHLHPEPGSERGQWTCSFAPRGGGVYRIFADFTPAATGRPLYAVEDLPVVGPEGAAPEGFLSTPACEQTRMDGLELELKPSSPPLAGQALELNLRLRRTDGGTVDLETVMGTYVHLVAFDRARSGFAHLHPTLPEPAAQPDLLAPSFNFKSLFPEPGLYVVWAQFRLQHKDQFVPFWFTVRSPTP